MTPSPAPRRRAPVLAVLALAALALPAAHAQDLARLLPADTAFALGTHGLGDAQALIAPLLDPWVELGVGQALTDALAGADVAGLAAGAGLPDGAEVDPEALADALPPELEGLDLWALLAHEAWVGVSVSPFNPLPALTLLARVDDDVAARFDALLARVAGEPGAQALTEGAVGFVVAPQGEGFVLAAARHGDLLALSSNPDVLRGVLRLAQGASEPGFLDAPGVAATLGTLGVGELYGFLDLGPLARALAPLANGLGFDASVARLVDLFETLGAYAGVTRLSEDGATTTTLRQLNGAGRDEALRALLGAAGPAPRELLAWVPSDALSVQVTALDPGAWWTYVRDLVEGLTELGVPDLDRTLQDVVGVDPAADLFDWTAPGLAIVQTGVGAPAELGAPAQDLLGESVWVLRARDAATAEAGLARAMDALTQRAVVFADPFAQPGGNGATVAVRTSTVAGTTVRAYDLFPGLTLATAVAAGPDGPVALIATTEGGLAAVLEAGGAGVALPGVFDALLATVPSDASAFVLTDDRAVMASTGAALGQQVQLLAGFGGGIDFAAVERATAALDAYFEAIAPRFGGSASWSRAAGATIEGAELTRVDLR